MTANITLDLPWLTAVIGVTALIFVVVTVFSVMDYRSKHGSKVRFVSRCKDCFAEVLEPVVLDDAEIKKQIIQSAAGLASGLAGINAHFGTLKSSVRCKVLYYVEDRKIITVIERKSGLRHPKPGDMIPIFYDPELPEHAFANDMKSVMLHEPLTECIVYGAAAIVLAVVFFVLLLNPDTQI